MENNYGAIFEETTLREVCTNIADVMESMKQTYPELTKAEMGRLAGVHFTTISRWQEKGRADADPVRRLIEEVNLINEPIKLAEATDFQLYRECSKRGWKRVIECWDKG